MDFKIKLVLCVVLQIFSTVLAQNNTIVGNNKSNDTVVCNKRTNRQLDAIFAKMYTFGNSGRNFPTNSAESLIYCKYV